MPQKTNQTGFAAVEAVLIVVILAILGGTGWFVWHSKQATDASLTNTANSQPGIAKKPAAPTSTKPVSSTATAQKYLVIKEWGVRMKLTDNLKDAYYVIKPDTSSSAFLSLQSLTAVAPECAPDKISVGVLFRQTTAEHDTTVSEQTAPYGDVRIGNYYYGYVGAQAGCFDSSNTAAENLFNSLQPRSGFATAEKSLEAVTN